MLVLPILKVLHISITNFKSVTYKCYQFKKCHIIMILKNSDEYSVTSIEIAERLSLHIC